GVDQVGLLIDPDKERAVSIGAVATVGEDRFSVKAQ
ncbi:MAG: hypothetical protein RIS70_3390, partial [Planctomycetota bacterium]